MISTFDLFKIGIGPSSSHTVGPMKAALAFCHSLTSRNLLPRVNCVQVRLFGSLAWTGNGHGTEKAVILGLSGYSPETIDPDIPELVISTVRQTKSLNFDGSKWIDFDVDRDFIFDRETSPSRHPNTLAFMAFDSAANLIHEERWCSIGGGFVVREADIDKPRMSSASSIPFPFKSGKDLLEMGLASNRVIADMVYANELALRSADIVDSQLDRIVDVMMACIDRGMMTGGVLPGGLGVPRRAPKLHEKLCAGTGANDKAPHEILDWVGLYAIAVNEENAAGGRVVTAPTNGAAGIVPATLRYFRDHCRGADARQMRTFLLTASAIGALFKMNASISGAEVGCQGEVGVACSMAAAGLAAVLGGSNAQIENAAEIGMEHHLGMTCDPIGGLVQVPCIERNAFGAIKAISAASLALQGDGSHVVSLDKVIATMRETGRDMQTKYKETSLGGLAANLAEC
ncbi:MAG: L-serine ammonia-lyase [Bradyrhizobiaceae bacterium]|nr:MAG: L-serine ammonia-lyase [Bradyrhizobiaceae bacterium]